MELTPKEKAEELFYNMYNTEHCGIEHFPNKHYCDCNEINLFQAKQCALLAVNEMYKLAYELDNVKMMDYYNDVEQEIEKL